jgi:hypothetical protein
MCHRRAVGADIHLMLRSQGVLLGGRMNARSGTSACTACRRPEAQQMGPGGLPGVALEDEAPPVVLVSVVRA